MKTANQQRISTFMLSFTFILITFLMCQAQLANQNPSELQNIDIDEHLSEYIPLDLQFTDEQGQTVLLGDYFNQEKPIILVLAYYKCPMLCTLVLNGLTQSVYKLKMQFGDDYKILTVSIDPTESFELAAGKKQSHLKMLNQTENNDGWTFLTGTESSIRKLADAVGFKYYYVEDRDEFAHPAVIMLLSEEGKISRYLYGIEYKMNDLKLGLLEAAEGKVGSTIDRLILYCYHYDPNAKGYVVLAANVMKIGGAATLVVLFGFLGFLWLRETRKKPVNYIIN